VSFYFYFNILGFGTLFRDKHTRELYV